MNLEPSESAADLLKARESNQAATMDRKKRRGVRSLLPKLRLSQSEVQLTQRIIDMNTKPPFKDPLVLGKGAKSRMNDKLLHEAKRGDIRAIQTALRAGADPASQDIHGFSALCYTCLKDHMDATRVLLQFSADINKQSHCGNTPLHYAASSGRLRMVKFLLSDEHVPRARINQANNKGMTALHVATLRNQLESVMALTSVRKCDVDAADIGGWTPLMYACREGRMGCVKILIEKGCNINCVNMKGERAIQIAKENYQSGIWGLLFQHPASGKTSKWGADKSPYPCLGDVKFCFAPNDFPEGMDDAQMEVKLWKSDHTGDPNYAVTTITQKELDRDGASEKRKSKKRNKRQKEFRGQITTLQLMKQSGLDLAKCSNRELEEICGAQEGAFEDGRARRALGLPSHDEALRKK